MKKIIGIMLAVIMLFSLMSVSVMASEEEITLSDNTSPKTTVFFSGEHEYASNSATVNDGDATTYLWLKGTSKEDTWVAFDFGIPCQLTEISVINRKTSDGEGDFTSMAFVIEASNDKDFADVTVLDTLTASPFTEADGSEYKVTLSNAGKYTNKYRYVRVRSNAWIYLILGDVSVKGYYDPNDVSIIENLVKGTTPFKYRYLNEGNLTCLTDGKTIINDGTSYAGFETRTSYGKDGGDAYVSFDLGCVTDVYSVTYGLPANYSLKGNAYIYGSDDPDNLLNTRLAELPYLESNPADREFKIEFDGPKSYRYITICRLDTSEAQSGTVFRTTEIMIYGTETQTLELQNYSITACDISKSGNDIVATAGIANRGTSSATSPVFILAIYGENDSVETLVASAVIPSKNISAGKIEGLTATIEASALNGKTYNKAKLFAFDATDGLTPICMPFTADIAN